MRKVIALAVAGLLLAGCSGASREDVAKDSCRAHVLASLKTPTTAQFTWGPVTHDGLAYTVPGAVDAQNSFGAMVRTAFSCQASDAAHAGTMSIDYVQGIDGP